MFLEVKENSACILIEKSRQTEPFLPALKELIISILLEKCDQETASNPSRFNIAYFNREPVFWADQVTHCTADKANNAAQWIRSWTPLRHRDGDPTLVAPRTMMAIVAAFNDPFVGALYLLTSSLPFESADDLINHVKYASKDRPVHVIFLTSRSHFDERAMELLHLVSRTTGGTFRVAYYDENGPKTGRLIEVPALGRHRTKSLFPDGSESSLTVSPVPVTALSPSVEPASFRLSPTETTDMQRFQKLPSAESFSDLVIKTPKATQGRSKSIGRDILIRIEPAGIGHQNGCSSFEDTTILPLESRVGRGNGFFSQENTTVAEEADPGSLGTTQMDVIKRDFAEFYWKKRKTKGASRSPTKAPDPLPSSSKSVDFEEPSTSSRGIAVSPPTPLSSLSSTSDDDDEPLEKYSPKKIEVPEKAALKRTRCRNSPDVDSGNRLHQAPSSDRRISPSSQSPTGRIPVSIYSKSHYSPLLHSGYLNPRGARQSPTVSLRSPMSSAKRTWRPATAKKHFVTSPKSVDGRMGTEDRSRAWMNRWLNDWVRRHEQQQGPNRVHAAIQAVVDKDVAMPALQRSKSEPGKLQLNTYTQTPQEEKVIGEEIHTIRELLTRNNSLLNALSRSTNTARNVQTKGSPPQKQIADFGRLNLGDRLPQQQLTTRAAGVQPGGPLQMPEEIAVQQSQALQTSVGSDPHWPNWSQGHKTRRDQLHSAFERKEAIRKQQEEACYKAMYQKLADDLSRRNVPEKQAPARQAMTNGGEKMELIARLPFSENGFQG